MSEEILTTTEAAKLLGVSVRTAQLLVEGGAVPSWKTPGGHRRMYRSDILALRSSGNPAPAFSSAVIVLVAAPDRLTAYEAALRAAGGFLVDSYSDPLAALFAVGSRLPAAIVVDREDADARRAAFLDHVASNPALGHTMVISVENSPRAERREGEPENRRLRVSALPELAQAVRAALHAQVDAVGPKDFPVGPNERHRLVAVERSGLVDSPPEDAFDRLTWLAAGALETPIALITLLTPDRQWFKSRHGLEIPEAPRGWAFCNHTILQSEVLVVEDLAADERFQTNPVVVGEPKFRFYAGAPIVDPDGFPLGSLCVIDIKPRRLDERQRRTLESVAALTSDEIRLRATDRRLRWALEALNRGPR